MVRKRPLRIAFGVLSIGLGHATRSLPVITELIARGHEVHVLSSGRSLVFLREALGDSASFTELSDYSLSDTMHAEKGASVGRFALSFPLYASQVVSEHRRFLRWFKKTPCDCIVSDTRFGFYHEVPSFLIFHHFRLDTSVPGSRKITERVLSLVRHTFDHVFIPDYEEPCLAGEIAHGLTFIPEEMISYVGVLSMVRPLGLERDVPLFVSISGPEPQRTVFERAIMDRIGELPEGSVITLGNLEDRSVRMIGGVSVHGSLGREEQERMLNRAQLVLTRSGYSTIMDLAQAGTRGLLIPTKGQPEQEYLARYHASKGNYYSTRLEDLDLKRQLPIARSFPGFIVPHRSDESVRRIVEMIERSVSDEGDDRRDR
ncbi:MAG: glycosyltransferase family protein [Candidatus Woesearchaeota archaeon]